jgi:hypothetical protein
MAILLLEEVVRVRLAVHHQTVILTLGMVVLVFLIQYLDRQLTMLAEAVVKHLTVMVAALVGLVVAGTVEFQQEI